MKTRSLKFERLSDIVLFLDMIDKKPYELNKELLQVTGRFTLKEVELAKSAFAATAVNVYD